MSQAGSFNNGSGPGSGNVRTLTGNTGGPVPPDGIGNIDIIGDGGITVTGNPGTNTLTISDGGSASNFTEDVGFAAPIAGNLNIFGGTLIQTSGDTLDTVTINLLPGLDGQVPIGATGMDPLWANITSTDLSITITNGPNSIDLSASGGGGATEFDADTGTATPMAGVINIFGGPNINTDASGNTVNVNLDTSIDLPDTTVGFTAGTFLLNSVPFMHNFGGTDGGGGGSANAFFAGAGNDTLTNGAANLGIGLTALSALDTGQQNIAIGTSAMFGLVDGGSNIAIGLSAGNGIVSATENIYIGNQVGGTDAIQNVAIGQGGAFSSLFTSNGNVVVGYAAATTITNDNNIAIGFEALNGVGDSLQNIAIGVSAGNGLAGASTTSNILIGNAGVNTDNNTIRIGTQGTGTGEQDAAYMAGIYQASVGVTNEFVIIDSTGKLGSTPSSPGGFSWIEVTASTVAMAVNTGYIMNNAGGVTGTLPATTAVGDIIAVVGKNAGGWTIAQNSGQTIHFGEFDTTPGAGGSLASTLTYDSFEIVCITANTDFAVRSSIGNITYV